MENLFGKRQSQVGAAILSNFDQARSAIEKMEASAGSANREMEKIESSLEYRLNALKETWVGVAQNLFQTEDLKAIISALTAFSDLIDNLTGSLGLFGTVGLMTVIAGLKRFQTTINSINTAVNPVLQTLSNINYDASVASVFQYATALGSLTPIQQKLAMDTLGLSAAQREQIATMMAATTVVKQWTVAEMERNLGVQAGTIANQMGVASTAMVTEEVLRAALANGILTEEQLKNIAAIGAQSTANLAGAASFTTLGSAAKAAGAAMMATPMGWITLLIGVLPLAITGVKKLYDALIVTKQEAYDAAEEQKKAYDETTKEIEELDAELDENKARLAELQALSEAGTITLIEQDELDKLKVTNAELATTIARKKELAEISAEEANKSLFSI